MGSTVSQPTAVRSRQGSIAQPVAPSPAAGRLRETSMASVPSELDDTWGISEEECITMGIPSDWTGALVEAHEGTAAEQISNKMELRDVLCSLGCSEEAAEGLVVFLISELTVNEQTRFFGEVLPCIVQWVRELPEAIRSIRVLPTKTASTTASQTARKTALLMPQGQERAITIPRTRQRDRTRMVGSFTLERLYSLCLQGAPQEKAKLSAIINYFMRSAKSELKGSITIRRLVLNAPPRWSESSVPVVDVQAVDRGSIDSDIDAARVVFASRSMAGCLNGGAWQEEITFVAHPEMMVLHLFCEQLGDNDAIFVGGAERFADLSGYAFQLSFAGDYVDPTPKAPDGSACSFFLLMDARDYRSTGRLSQFLESSLLRDAGKAFCAFTSVHGLPVATGRWGCDNYLGDYRLKCILQVAAAAQAGVPRLRLFTGEEGGDRALESLCHTMVQRKVTVGHLWKALLAYAAVVGSKFQQPAEETQGPSTEAPPAPPEATFMGSVDIPDLVDFLRSHLAL
eukprot:m51a1_g11720 hypothetical protein (513) ;mRNA; f:96089-97939